MEYDIAIVGAGPAGSTTAALCAKAGLKTVLIEKSRFPREKVCGDCLNPGCAAVLERLGVFDELRRATHRRLDAVEFRGLNGRPVVVALPASGPGEIAVRRSLLDQILVVRAVQNGAEFLPETTVSGVKPGWSIETRSGEVRARAVVAADGRNSTVARLLGLLPAAARNRVGLQAHFPLPEFLKGRVALWLLEKGYCGLADVGGDLLNICLVGCPDDLPTLREWAAREFPGTGITPWRSITPLSRAPTKSTHPGLLFTGDVARVVEPYTGEGIYYALKSGELAADELIAAFAGSTLETVHRRYAQKHEALYHGRLWVNRLARFAVENPRTGSAFFEIARHFPILLTGLTSKVVNQPIAARMQGSAWKPG